MTLLKSRFKKSLETYKNSAVVQKIMAKNLAGLLEGRYYNSILEIGCGCGFLTEICTQNLVYKRYIANDIIPECSEYVKKIDAGIEFLPGNIKEIALNGRYDLILSNAVLQWVKEPHILVEKLKENLNAGGVIAFSTFGSRNFYEIKEIFGIGIEYPVYSGVVREDITEIEFPSLAELLKHIKQTGVNAITNYTLTRGKLKELETKYINRFGKIKLTYNPVYVLIKKIGN